MTVDIRIRRKFSSRKKLRILKQHYLDGNPIHFVCEDETIHPNLFYRWRNQLFQEGHKVFELKESNHEQNLKGELNRLKTQLLRKNEVLAELLEENLKIKKINKIDSKDVL